jgi:hypothetical protein
LTSLSDAAAESLGKTQNIGLNGLPSAASTLEIGVEKKVLIGDPWVTQGGPDE